MSKVSSVVSNLASRRSYSVCARAANVHVIPTAAADRVSGGEAANVGTRPPAMKKDVFWMKDPKTGCWIPENRFQDEVDDVELRNRLLRYK